MKNLIIALVVVVAILAIGIGEQFYIVETLTTMDNMCEELLELLLENDIDNAKIKTINMIKYWDKRSSTLDYIYSYKEFDDIPSTLGELNGNMRSDNAENAIANVTHIQFCVISRLDRMRYNISNIL